MEARMTVTLLGTGTPAPSAERFSQSSLVEAGDQRLLIDCGRGAVIRLAQAGVVPGIVDPVFLTHLHSDHIVGIPDLWITGWFRVGSGARRAPLRVFGPSGTEAMMHHLAQAYVVDREARVVVEGKSRDGSDCIAQDISEGVVYSAGDVTVTAIRVDHWHHPEGPEAFGYRVEYQGRSIVFSGDTRYSTHLAGAARGADVLVHEVQLTDMTEAEDAQRRANPDSTSLADLIMALHTSPWDAGRVFEAAQPRLAVYSHIIQPPSVSEAELVARTRETYSGPLEIGRDLMRISIGDEVTVEQIV